MRAIILAAGRGSRMGGMTAASPKCLVPLGGRPLLDWQTSALRAAGIERISIVTGWQSEQLANRGAVTFHNSRWAETNMVMSLASAADWLAADGCIVSYSDIFYPVGAVRDLAACSKDIAITYDPNWFALWSRRFADPLADAETFKLDANGRVVEIGKRTSNVELIEGQYMGLLKFTPAGWSLVARFLEGLPPHERDRLDMTGFLQRLIMQDVGVYAVPVHEPWGEVDSESDLAIYERDIREGRLRAFARQ